jgi:hypothetical protein
MDYMLDGAYYEGDDKAGYGQPVAAMGEVDNVPEAVPEAAPGRDLEAHFETCGEGHPSLFQARCDLVLGHYGDHAGVHPLSGRTILWLPESGY